MLLALLPDAAAAQAGSPAYVGSAACVECHGPTAARWENSHHALAWTMPTAETVDGDFGDVDIEHRGVLSRAYRRDGRYFIQTEGPDGTLSAFEIHSVAGTAPLQQYLAETEPGRLQALDLSWDRNAKRWFHLYPEAALSASDGLHWTGPYKNWNARCAECHATGYHKNYDAGQRRYSSSQAEIGVGCEACHGPGEAHLAWAAAPRSLPGERWQGVGETGLTVGFTPDNPETEIQQCAGCHSRREPLADHSPVPGTPFHDAYRLALLRDGLYHADGTILDEVYVYGSFLQSKMYASGVRCSDCHDPHGAVLRADGNAICTQCHSPSGNDRFPRLNAADYDTPNHHFHPPESDGAQCKACHMVERVYMQIDGRRDHSFRIPRPDLSDETGAPNACTDCHADRSAAWAANEIATRFPDGAAGTPHFSQTFARARREPAAAAEALLAIAAHDALPGIVRATALSLAQGVPGGEAAAAAAPLMADGDPLVREAAVSLQQAAAPEERVRRLAPAFDDPAKSVRVAAARAILGTPSGVLTPELAEKVRAAIAEWQATLLAKTDFPETHLALGGTALVYRNFPAAEQAFREAVRLDPQRIDAWSMIIRIRAALGDTAGARQAAGDALRANPDDPNLQAFEKELGLP